MPVVHVPVGAKEISVEYTVIRADGTVGPTRVVYWHRNPFKRLAFHIKQLLRK